MLSFGLVFNAVLFALGVYWCIEVAKRWRSDWDDLRTVEDQTRRVVIVGVWILTAIIALLVVNSAIRLLMSIISGIQSLM